MCALNHFVLPAPVNVRVAKGYKQEMLMVREENSRVQIAEEQLLRMQCLFGGHMEVLGFLVAQR